MTKYLLADRERNGYDDSDFYAIFWNTETGKIESEEYGSTRFAGGYRVAPSHIYIRPVPPEIIAEAIAYKTKVLFGLLKQADEAQVMEPDEVNRGDRLTLLASGSFKDKNTGNKVPYAAGESGVVIWTGNFGTFYRNGYKKRGRSNCRVGIKLDSGVVIFVGLNKCRLEREVKTDAQILKDAENEANYQARFGWV